MSIAARANLVDEWPQVQLNQVSMQVSLNPVGHSTISRTDQLQEINIVEMRFKEKSRLMWKFWLRRLFYSLHHNAVMISLLVISIRLIRLPLGGAREALLFVVIFIHRQNYRFICANCIIIIALRWCCCWCCVNLEWAGRKYCSRVGTYR